MEWVLILGVTPPPTSRIQKAAPASRRSRMKHNHKGTRNSTLGLQSQCLKSRPWWQNTFLLLNFNFYGNNLLVWKIHAINLRQMSQSFGSWWKFFLKLCAQVVNFYCYHFLNFFRINWACFPFLSQNTGNGLGPWVPRVLVVQQQPNSQESPYRFSTVSGTGMTDFKGLAWNPSNSLSLSVPYSLVLSI